MDRTSRVKLRDWRIASELSAKQLAGRLGIDRATLSRYEAGRRVPGPPVLLRYFVLSGGRVQPNDFHLPGFAAAQQAVVDLALEIADLGPAQGTALFERLDVAAAAYREQLAALLEPAQAAQ